MSPTPVVQPCIAVFGNGFRITTYEIESGEFTGSTYDLQLLHELIDDYFVMINGNDEGNGTPNLGGVRVTHDPNGTGDLGVSSAVDEIRLTRNSSTTDWVGSVIVVECEKDQTTAGFTLLDVLDTSLASAGSVPQSTNDTLNTGWSDIDQVVPFGGPGGGGSSCATTTADDWPTLTATIALSGTDTVTFKRDSHANLVEAADFTTFFVEWGSEWTIQNVSVSGSAGGDDVDSTGEYNTGTITSVTRDNTWLFPTVITDGCVGIGCSEGDAVHGYQAVVTALGDGVTQNASETKVAVGKEKASSREAIVYVLEHSRLAVDWRKKSQSDSSAGDMTYDVTVDNKLYLEDYDEVSNPATTTGYRFGVATTGGDGLSGAERFHNARFTWFPRHTATGTLKIARPKGSDSVTFPAWIQSVDFANI